MHPPGAPEHLALSGGHFVVFYLLVQGILKLALAVGLLRGGGRWIFPVGARDPASASSPS